MAGKHNIRPYATATRYYRVKGELKPHAVELYINFTALIDLLGTKAQFSKNKQSKALKNAIKCKVKLMETP